MRLLDVKFGTGTLVVAILVVFFAAIAIAQYKMQGELTLRGFFGQSAGRNPFWEKNPGLEKVDSFKGTPLVAARVGGKTALLDLRVVGNAGIQERACESAPLAAAMIYPEAENSVCFGITDSEPGFVSAMSYMVQAKDTMVADFYRRLIEGTGKTVLDIQDGVSAQIFEGRDARDHTVLSVAVRHSGDTAQIFLAWTGDFR